MTIQSRIYYSNVLIFWLLYIGTDINFTGLYAHRHHDKFQIFVYHGNDDNVDF